jgi:hypothetical protein
MIMRAFFAAVAAALIIAVGSGLILDRVWERSDRTFTSRTGVSLPPDHGNTHNLVGKDWWSARDH